MNRKREKWFVRMPGFAAGFYDGLMQLKDIRQVTRQIAKFLVCEIDSGRLLDVGAGPGNLLLAIHELNPDLELYGLDISDAMIQTARKKLGAAKVDLRRGNICSTDYEDNTFDIVTCSGSLYLWDHPEQGLEEIRRILKENHSAYLFEVYSDCDFDEVRGSVRENLERENLLKKLLLPQLMKKVLKSTYRYEEFSDIITHTSFAHSFEMEKVRLGNVPFWLRITLTKHPGVGSSADQTSRVVQDEIQKN